MFEPIGGSAPKYTGQNVINPLAAICAGAMMLDTLGEAEAAAGRRGRPSRTSRRTSSRAWPPGAWATRTTEVGDLVAERVAG